MRVKPMNVQLEKMFGEVYRQFKRVNPGCDDNEKLNKVLDNVFGVGNYSSNPASIRAMEEIKGFCVCYSDYKIFIPCQSALDLKMENLKYYADAFSQAEIIIPAYMPMGVLGPLSKEIIISSDKEAKLKHGDMALTTMFPSAVLARLSVDHYSKFSDLDACLVQIRETVEAYCMGLYRLAITALLHYCRVLNMLSGRLVQDLVLPGRMRWLLLIFWVSTIAGCGII